MSVGKRTYNILRGYVNREWERIKDLDRVYAEQELDDPIVAPAPPPSQAPSTMPPMDRAERARQLLGVGPDANFEVIRKSFERLNKRSDPGKFPAGSSEAIQAAAEKAASVDIDPASDIHATAEFRRHLANVLSRRA